MSHLHVTNRDQTSSCLDAGPHLLCSSSGCQATPRTLQQKPACVGLPTSLHLELLSRHMPISMFELAHGGLSPRHVWNTTRPQQLHPKFVIQHAESKHSPESVLYRVCV